jgi:UDP-N-acetylglucosamine:LPS N-acetylglucosamine transferase
MCITNSVSSTLGIVPVIAASGTGGHFTPSLKVIDNSRAHVVKKIHMM